MGWLVSGTAFPFCSGENDLANIHLDTLLGPTKSSLRDFKSEAERKLVWSSYFFRWL
jgi:hypothetical protein